MNQLIIAHNKPKAARIFGIVAGAYFTAFCLYFTITEVLANRFDFWFFASLIGAILGLAMLLRNVLLKSKFLLKIDNTTIESNITPKSPVAIEWVNVSEVTLGISYAVFLLNGQKQQKLELNKLVYDDMRSAKNQIVETCEHKNIPYKND